MNLAALYIMENINLENCGMNNKTYLIVWNQDWADEFDLFGFDIVDEIWYKTILNAIDDYLKDHEDKEFEFYFGTNEFWPATLSDVKEILKDAKEINDKQLEVLNDLFGVSAGQCFLENVEDILIESGYLKEEDYT